jgi:hypothetical protein
MGTEIGVGVLLRPAVENLGERGGLSTARWEILLEHEHEYDVAFGGEVRDVLGNDRAAFPRATDATCASSVARRPSSVTWTAS